MKVTVVEYNQKWPRLFEQERDSLLTVLAKTVAGIEHVGSTAVPGLAARPVIDIMIGLYNFSEADGLVQKVVALDYTYIPEYESVMPNRRFFKKIQNGKITHHIHMVEINSEFWKRHLLFRDYLRENREVAKKYGLLKEELAKQEWKDTNDYAEAKTQFIRKIEEQIKLL